MAALAYVGLFLSIKRWRSPPHLFAALALFFGLLTLVVTEPASGAMRRTIVAIPWVFGLAGIGAVFISDTLRRRSEKWGRVVATACVAAVLLVGGFWNLKYYFVELPQSSTFQFTFPQYYFEGLDAANSFDDPGTIYYYSGQRTFTYETIRFLYPENRGIDRSHEFGAFDLEKIDPGPVTYLLEGAVHGSKSTQSCRCILVANSSLTTATSRSTSYITSQANRISPAICSPGPNHESLLCAALIIPNSCQYGRLRAQTPSGGSGPLRRACAPFAAKAAQGWRRQTPAAARGYALFGRSGFLRPSLVRGDTPRNAPLQNHRSPTVRLHPSSAAQPRWRQPTNIVPVPPCAMSPIIHP